jgi:hypothetical protein
VVRVSTKTGAEGFRTDIVAGSIWQALGILEEQYPSAGARVIFPVDPNAFFIAKPERVGTELKMPQSIAV